MKTTKKTIRVPKPIRHELWARLEESGASLVGDDRMPLWIKLRDLSLTNGEITINDKEARELRWHCQTMVEIASDDHLGLDKQLNLEARWAKYLLKSL